MPSRSSPSRGRRRAQRSDAAANRERVLQAAALAIRRQGEKVPMATIAREAHVGVGTLYRHFATRADLLAALAERSYRLVLGHAQTAAASQDAPAAALTHFLDQTIAAGEQLILPLHGGPVGLDAGTVALRTEISDRLEQVVARGRVDGSIRPDVAAVDIIITAAMLAQRLPHVTDWDVLARRQARIYVAGLAATKAPSLPGGPPTRAQLEASFARAGDAQRR
jgi:AcrR family transcriptional regulator